MRGVELFLDPIKDRLRGLELAIEDNVIIEVRDSITNNIINTANITIAGSTNDNGVQLGGEYNFVEPNSVALTISAAAPSYTVDSEAFAFTGKGALARVTLILVKITLEFDCDILTFTEGGASLNQKISSSENTVIKATFTTTNMTVPPTGQLRCIIRQWASVGNLNEGVFEYPLTSISESLSGFSLVYTLVITPEEANRGDRISARLIDLP
jgi:hypothetical protein